MQLRYVFTVSDEVNSTATIVVRVPLGWYVTRRVISKDSSAILSDILIPDGDHVLDPESFRGPYEILRADA